jgi:LysR family hydrogen peroxide-inducible transcriptional activator
MRSRHLPTLKQLQYFAALAEAGHYRKAAERLGISQPSLSVQIGNLEAALRIPLVERGRAGAVLTPAGREVLARAKGILDDVSALAETSERMRTDLAGTFRLGSSTTLGPYLLPHVVRRLHADHPALRLIIRDGRPRDLLDDLVAGRLDLVLTQLPVLSADVTVTRLFREPLWLAVAHDHPLAGRSNVTEADLAEQTLLALSGGFALHAQIAEVARDVRATLRQDYEGTSLDALRQMVAMNMGITFLPALYANSEVTAKNSDVSLVPFRNGRFTRSIGIVWRKTAGKHPGFAVFADVIRSVVGDEFVGTVQMDG